jgi:predicted DNA-binding transcriptional regulator AlpA
MSDETDDDLFVSYEDLSPKHGIDFTRVHLRRLMAKGQFPPAYQLSPNRVAWKLSELKVWKANRPRRVPVAA